MAEHAEVVDMVTERKHEMGAGGFCLCPRCGEKIPHIRGERCIEQRCPKCNSKMIREGSDHHERIERKRTSAGRKSS